MNSGTKTNHLILSWILAATLFLRLHSYPDSPSDHCQGTLYPELCVSTLSKVPDWHSKPLPQVICATINASESAVRKISNNCTNYLSRQGYALDSRQRYALGDCLDLFSQTLDELRAATADLQANASLHVDDTQTVLSAAITNQYTCLDGFAYVDHGGGYRSAIENGLYHVSHLVSNSLAMLKKVRKRQGPRREALEGYGEVARGWPAWVRAKDRRLLQTVANSTKVDLVVAKDGSGNFTTITEAVAAAPKKSDTRFVIYIKAGTYLETVDVGKSLTNLMFMGDGIGKTVVKGNKNVVDGFTTFRSATVGEQLLIALYLRFLSSFSFSLPMHAQIR